MRTDSHQEALASNNHNQDGNKQDTIKYPENITNTDQKLKQVQNRLAYIMGKIQYKHQQQQKQTGTSASNQNMHNMPNGKKDLTLQQNDRRQNQPQSQIDGKYRSRDQDQRVKIQQMIRRWTQEDQIDNMTKQLIYKTICFYESTINQNQKQYQEMKQYFLGLLRANQQKSNQDFQPISVPVDLNGESLLNQRDNTVSINKNIFKSNSLPNQIHDQHSLNLANSITIANINSSTNQQNTNEMITDEKQDRHKSNTALQTSKSSVQFPRQYIQLMELQNKITQVRRQNKQLLQQIQNERSLKASIEKQLQQTKSQQEEKNKIIDSLNQQIGSLQKQIQEINRTKKQLNETNASLSEKISQKQKQLLKFIHNQSSFAAQQLTSLQSALIMERQQKEKDKLSYCKKIEELQQDIRHLNHLCQAFKLQIGEHKRQMQKYKARTNIANLQAKSSILSTQSVQNLDKQQKQAAINALASAAVLALIPDIGKNDKNSDDNSSNHRHTNGNAQTTNDKNAQTHNGKRNLAQIPTTQSFSLKSMIDLRDKNSKAVTQNSNPTSLNNSVNSKQKAHNQDHYEALQVKKKETEISEKQQNGELKLTGYITPISDNSNTNNYLSKYNKNKIPQQQGHNNKNKIKLNRIEDYGQVTSNEVKFKKVLSVGQVDLERYNTRHIKQTDMTNTKTECIIDYNSDQKHGEGVRDVNIKTLNETLLVPIQSVDEISIALDKLQSKLQTFKSLIKTQPSSKQPTPKQKLSSAFQIENRQEEGQRIKIENQNGEAYQKNIKDGEINAEEINKHIYGLAQQLSEISTAIMSNFYKYIAKIQNQGSVNKVDKNRTNINNQNNQVSLAEPQKLLQQNQTTNSDSRDKQIPQTPVTEQNMHTVQQILQQNNILAPQGERIIQSYQDYNKAFKMINKQLKLLFQNFFNDSKIALEDEGSVNGGSNQCINTGMGSNTSINIFTNKDKNRGQNTQQNQKEEQIKTDEKQILEIVRKLSQLHSELMHKRKQISSRNKEKVQRLFDVIRSMIINFKISFKSMNNLLMSKELGELNKSKYMHLRVYLNSLYQVLEKQNMAKLGINTQNRSSNQSQNAPKFTLYQNYEQKLQKLTSELSKLRLQLDYKSQQHQNLKQLTTKYLQVHQFQQKKQIQKQLQRERQADQQDNIVRAKSNSNLRASRDISNRSKNTQNKGKNKQPTHTLQIPVHPNNIQGSSQNSQEAKSDDPKNYDIYNEPLPQGTQQLKNLVLVYRKKCKQYQSLMSNQKSVAGSSKSHRKIIRIRK